MTTERVLALAESVVFRPIDDQEGCLLDIDSMAFYSVNATGIVILEGLRQGAPRARLLEELRRQFADAPPTQLAEDLDGFLRELDNLGMLRRDAD